MKNFNVNAEPFYPCGATIAYECAMFVLDEPKLNVNADPFEPCGATIAYECAMKVLEE